MNIVLLPEHGYVFAVAVLYFAIGQILGAIVGRARKKYRIFYPNLYANAGMFIKDGKVDEKENRERGDAFNQVQRGHQHMFELHADAVLLLLLSGIKFPTEAAIAGLLYAVGTLVYGVGYSIKVQLRLVGELIYFPGLFWQIFLVGKTAYTLLYA